MDSQNNRGLKIAFTAHGAPEPQGSARAFVRGGRAVVTSDNPDLHGWRQVVAWAAQQHRPAEVIRGPVRVRLRFYLTRPASVSERRRPRPIVKPDLDKLTRAVLDALTGIVWADDSQVVEVEASKNYGDARVEIEVSEA